MNEGHLDSPAIDALVSGTAGAGERAHVDTCADCREALDRVESVAQRLKEMSSETPDIPAEVDRRILARAAIALRRPVGRRVWIAAAAAVVMVGLVGWLARAPRRVDIVDAYQLALRIRDGGAGSQADVNAIVRECVSLKGGRR